MIYILPAVVMQLLVTRQMPDPNYFWMGLSLIFAACVFTLEKKK